MKVLVKVMCILSDLEVTIWAYFAVCMSCCLTIKHFISKLMTESHWLIFSFSRSTVWLKCQTTPDAFLGQQWQCTFTIKFTIKLYNSNNILY